ncbi:MAG: EamA family transporter [Candidatus Krumholzibacteria bacterium]|nr:EamA family transporter [Candidatus Krumholzibacteria bacterium]MDH4338060.1 EamA family transporter [Candidatus Krumholzibacteria bacterium]MDH5269411.1 EamA family transporter [Candidatus Krumholzibacteria bacterium]
MQIRGLVHLLIVYIVWGSTYLGIRIAVREGAGFPPFVMAGSRILVAGSILLLWGALARQKLRPTRGDVAVFASSGLLLWLGGNGLVTWAEQRAESGYAALLVGSAPLWTTMVESFIDRRPPTLRLLGALLIGLAGLAVLNYPVLRHGSRADVLSALALLAAVMSWGVGSIYQKRRPVTLSGEANAAYQLLFGSVALLLVSMLAGEPRPTPTPSALAAWGYLIIFGSVVAFTSFVKALKLLPVSVVMTYAYVNPVIAVLLGWMILGEQITLWTFAGSVLVILGVMGVFHEMRRARNARRRAATAAG